LANSAIVPANRFMAAMRQCKLVESFHEPGRNRSLSTCQLLMHMHQELVIALHRFMASMRDRKAVEAFHEPMRQPGIIADFTKSAIIVCRSMAPMRVQNWRWQLSMNLHSGGTSYTSPLALCYETCEISELGHEPFCRHGSGFGVPASAGHAPDRLKPGLQTDSPLKGLWIGGPIFNRDIVASSRRRLRSVEATWLRGPRTGRTRGSSLRVLQPPRCP